ncbi:MAG: hypothetical protein ACI4MJ_04145 [Aristaeellaceae bacterium]
MLNEQYNKEGDRWSIKYHQYQKQQQVDFHQPFDDVDELFALHKSLEKLSIYNRYQQKGHKGDKHNASAEIGVSGCILEQRKEPRIRQNPDSGQEYKDTQHTRGIRHSAEQFCLAFGIYTVKNQTQATEHRRNKEGQCK